MLTTSTQDFFFFMCDFYLRDIPKKYLTASLSWQFPTKKNFHSHKGPLFSSCVTIICVTYPKKYLTASLSCRSYRPPILLSQKRYHAIRRTLKVTMDQIEKAFELKSDDFCTHVSGSSPTYDYKLNSTKFNADAFEHMKHE